MGEEFGTARTENGCLCGCPFGNLALELAAEDPSLREQLLQVYRDWGRYFETALREAVRVGEIPPRDVAGIAESLVAFCSGIALLAKTQQQRRPGSPLGPPRRRSRGGRRPSPGARRRPPKPQKSRYAAARRAGAARPRRPAHRPSPILPRSRQRPRKCGITSLAKSSSDRVPRAGSRPGNCVARMKSVQRYSAQEALELLDHLLRRPDHRGRGVRRAPDLLRPREGQRLRVALGVYRVAQNIVVERIEVE